MLRQDSGPQTCSIKIRRIAMDEDSDVKKAEAVLEAVRKATECIKEFRRNSLDLELGFFDNLVWESQIHQEPEEE